MHYKYFNESWAKEFSLNHELFFSKVSEFNDPHDTPLHQIEVSENYSPEQIVIILRAINHGKPDFALEKKYTGDSIKDFPSLMQQSILRLKDDGICCFSKELKSSVMWSHYTGHTGMAVRFDYLKFPELQRYQHTILNMKYSEEMRFYPLDENINKTIRNVCSLKTKEWYYEKEVRILVANFFGLMRTHPRSISAIYFGFKAQADFEAKIIRNLKATTEHRIDYYKMEPHYKTFALTPIPLKKGYLGIL